MENKNVGWLIIGIAIVIIGVIFIFNQALKDIVEESCTMEGHDNCTMYDTISNQTYLALSIVGILVIVGIFLIFSKQSERVIVQEVEKEKPVKNIDTSNLKAEELTVFKLIQEQKTIFQADLIEKTGYSKAKITRIIDRLEGQGFVERKRRGMTNVVVLKE